jgi:ubiquinone biosynthesis protein COQ4
MHVAVETLHPGGMFHLPEGAGWFRRLSVAARAIRVLVDNPEDGIAATMYQLSIDGPPYARLLAELKESEHGRALLRERPVLQADALDLPALRQLPEGTLGRALAQYYVDNGIKVLECPYPIRTDVDYLTQRYREIHDVVHLVTGYGTDPIGELEVQVFLMGNVGFRRTIMTVLSAAIARPYGLPPIWKYAKRLRAAYDRGLRSEELVISPRYEHMWELTIEQVRERVGLAS